MNSIATSIATFVVFVGFASSALAESWSHTKEFQYAKTASIRIVEPEGFKVTVNGTTDTVPAVFKFSNDNNYHSVTVTASDGKTWTKKIEVRAHKETILRVKYTPKGKAEPKASAKTRSFIGNVGNKCKRRAGIALRFDFLLNGDKQGSRALTPGQNTDVTLPGGAYDVRVFAANTRSKQWKFWKTFKYEIKADGWKFAPDC